MHTGLSWVSSLLNRDRRPWTSVGLDLRPAFASWVILSGSQSSPSSVVCAECVALPPGLVEAGRVTQPAELGDWLRHALQERGYAADVLSIGIEDAWITSHRVSLAPGLAQDDVLFQLLADVQSELHEKTEETEETDVRIDYRLMREQGPSSELTYAVQAVPSHRVTDAQQLARAARLKLVSLMSREQASELANTTDLIGGEGLALASVPPDHRVALGLALSAWHPAEFNFVPHREMAQHAARQRWLKQVSACCVGGACLGLAMVVSLQAMTDTLQAKHPPSAREAATRAHEAAKLTHTQLKALAQRADAQAAWLLVRQRAQASTLEWQRLLGQTSPGVWVSHVSQKGVQWSVQGEALSSSHAQEWVRRWGALDVWAKPPQLPAIQLTPAVSQLGVPVWQFQVEAELKAVR